MPSTVATKFHGRRRSYASVARSGCGNLRFLSRKFTSPIGFVPAPFRQTWIVDGSTLNAGAGVAVVLQLRNVMMLPEFTYAFSSQTYGGVPTNRPTPPRIWFT